MDEILLEQKSLYQFLLAEGESSQPLQDLHGRKPDISQQPEAQSRADAGV